MTFNYRLALVVSPDTGEPDMILRPEIHIRLAGPKGRFRYNALLDTGADRTIIPAAIAEQLGIPLRNAAGTPAMGFGGQALSSRHAEIGFALESAEESYHWAVTADFVNVPEGSAETVLLGYTGFLEFFRATFDPEHGVIELEPNSLHPAVQ